MSIEDFNAHAAPFYRKSKAKDYDYFKLSHLLQTRIEVFSQIPEKINFLGEFDKFDIALYSREKLKTDPEVAKTALPQAAKNLAQLNSWDIESINGALAAAAEQRSLKKGQVMWCVRIALTGREVTPGGAAEMADVLGRENSLERLNKSIDWLLNN